MSIEVQLNFFIADCIWVKLCLSFEIALLMYCRYVVRVMESVVGPEKYHLIAIKWVE